MEDPMEDRCIVDKQEIAIEVQKLLAAAQGKPGYDLLKRGIDANGVQLVEKRGGQTLLHIYPPRFLSKVEEPDKLGIEVRGLNAANEGRFDELKQLIETHGLTYAKRWGNGLVFLDRAVRARSDIVEYLVDAMARQGILREVQDLPSIEPVVAAITRNIKEVVEPLLEGPAPGKPIGCVAHQLHNPSGEYPSGRIGFRVQIVSILLKHSAKSLKDAITNGIALAVGKDCAKNGKELIELLLECGADVNWADREGHTALSRAIAGRDWDILSSLLRYKAHIDPEAFAKCTSFYVMKEVEKLIETFAEHGQTITVFRGDKDNGFFRGIREGNTQVLETLLQSGDFVLDVEGTDGQAEGGAGTVSPLHVAALYKQREVCAMLLKRGVNASAKDAYGDTAADYVIKNKDLSMLTFFLTNNKVDRDTALFTAVSCSQPDLELVEHLLRNGSSVFIDNKEGRTPLHAAAVANDSADCVKLLLEYGANPNARDNCGATPVLGSCWGPGPKVVDTLEALINYGGDINIGSYPYPKCSHSMVPIELRLFTKVAGRERANNGGPPEHKLAPCLLQQLTRLKVANLPVKPNETSKDLDLWIGTMQSEEYESACKKEVEEMKKTAIDDANSLFDILSASESQLADFAGNKNLMETVLCEEFSKRFPCYNGLIAGKLKFGKARRRRLLLDESHEAMQNMSSCPIL